MDLKGLIYCRVSSIKQVNEGNGLTSQEKRCRDYALNTLGIEIEKVFYEQGVSGGVFERKSMKELLKYIDTNKKTNYVVIFEDLNRLSRDIQVHNLLKMEFRKRGVELACANFQFENSPEGTFRENMSVSMAQYEKDKNRQRVNDRMRARLEQGFWCFKVPIGYKYSTNSKGGKEILIDEEKASIVKQAFKKYANNELVSVNDVVKFFSLNGIKTGTIFNGRVLNSSITHTILRNVLYAGYLEYEKWGIERRKANHKAIISLKLFEKVRNKLNGIKKEGILEKIEQNEKRKDRSEDFPLRGFLFCQNSNLPLSGAWSKGRKEKFPYYCFNKKSELAGKSVNRDLLHIEIENILKDIQPKEDLILAFEEALKIVFKNKEKENIENKGLKEKEIKNIDKKINNFLDRIGCTENEVLIKNYEEKIEELTRQKQEILEKIEIEVKSFRTPIKNKLNLVRNSLSIWRKGDLETKRKLIKNIFPEGIFIDEKKQVRTPTFSLIYQSFQLGKESKIKMVDYIIKNLNKM